MAKGKFEYWLTDPGLRRVKGWATDGLTLEQVAENMGISLSTLCEWRNRYPEISEALKEGKDDVDRQVENALFRSALEGNTTAQIFWLKNRKRLEWRDKQEIEHSGEVSNPLAGLSTEEIREYLKKPT